eukprot:5932686-Amphidinium_carterae.1
MDSAQSLAKRAEAFLKQVVSSSLRRALFFVIVGTNTVLPHPYKKESSWQVAVSVGKSWTA